MFRGTTSAGRSSRNEIYREITELTGGLQFKEDWTCYTSFEHIPLGLRVMKEDVGHAAELLADILLRASLDNQTIEAEKNIVLDEICYGKDNPWTMIWETFMETIFKRHPLRKSIVGSEETVRSLTAQEVRSFYEGMFIPQALIVAGDIGFRETMKLANKYFREFPERKEATLGINDEPENYTKNSRVVQGTHFHQAHLLMGLKVFNPTQKEVAGLEIIGSCLAKRFSDRVLNQEPISYMRRAGYFGSPSFSSSHYGFLAAYASFDIKHLARVEEIMREEFLKISNGDIDSKMIEQKIRVALKSYIFAQEKSMDIARLLLDYYLRGAPEGIYEYASDMKECSLQNLTEIIQKHVTACVANDSLTKVVLLP